MSESLPYQCLKRKDQRFLKRDSCDTKRKIPLEELEKRNPIDKMCFQCSGPSYIGNDEDIRKETDKQRNREYYQANKVRLDKKKNQSRQKPGKCTGCGKPILNTTNTGLCRPCGTKKWHKERKVKEPKKQAKCTECGVNISDTRKTGHCISCGTKEGMKRYREKKQPQKNELKVEIKEEKKETTTGSGRYDSLDFKKAKDVLIEKKQKIEEEIIALETAEKIFLKIFQ
jgi:hypothetical protein